MEQPKYLALLSYTYYEASELWTIGVYDSYETAMKRAKSKLKRANELNKELEEAMEKYEIDWFDLLHKENWAPEFQNIAERYKNFFGEETFFSPNDEWEVKVVELHQGKLVELF